MSKISLGRYVYGLAAIISGVLTFAWRDLNAWREIMPLDKDPHPQIFLYIAAAIELLGGLAILWAATRRIGAIFLGVIYLIFALLSVPGIANGGWVNVFEEFSLVSGALIVLGTTISNSRQGPRGLARIGYVFFGVCVISFTAAQVVYFFDHEEFGSEVDSPRTVVLGDRHHDCVWACGPRAAFWALCASCVSTAYHNARRIWASGMAADHRFGPTQTVQLD